ncbi:MAG: LysR family transcriptional regulator [Hyphomonadaceae bacterium]|nr:LysR family transcriptional regulator [Hyphomonadaceae bacterium]
MKLSLRQLLAFEAAARLGSFSRAAASLGISQPALSQAIREIETDIGYVLFDRTTRKITLTRAGQQFLPSVERVVNAYDSAREDLSNLASGKGGRVTVACLPSIGYGLLPKVLAAFLANHPDITVNILENRADQVAQSVRNGEADLGISNVVDMSLGLETRLLIEDAFAVVCRFDHPLAARRHVKWRDLQSTAVVAMTTGTGIWKEIESVLNRTGSRLSVRAVSDNPGTLLALIGAGVGVSPLPALAWPSGDHPLLVQRQLVEPTAERRVHLLTRAGEPMGPAARLFMPYVLKTGGGMVSADHSSLR